MVTANSKKLNRNPERNERKTTKIPPRSGINEQRTKNNGAMRIAEMTRTGDKTTRATNPSSVNSTGCV